MEQDNEKIYQEYFDEVFQYLFCLCHDKALAEDLTQETFICATFGINKFRNDCKIKVWLCQIAKNLLRKELKRQKKFITVSMDSEIGEMGASDSLEDEFIKREKRIEIYKQIDKLNSPYKELVYLKLTTELSFNEIGQVLGKSESWSIVTYYRAKQKILENIRKEEKENEIKQ